MHRGGSYHFPKALVAKHHLATHLPDDIEGLESVVKPVRSAIKSLHRLHAKHLEKICAKVSTVISYPIVKKNNASVQGFGDWVCEAIAGVLGKFAGTPPRMRPFLLSRCTMMARLFRILSSLFRRELGDGWFFGANARSNLRN